MTTFHKESTAQPYRPESNFFIKTTKIKTWLIKDKIYFAILPFLIIGIISKKFLTFEFR